MNKPRAPSVARCTADEGQHAENTDPLKLWFCLRFLLNV
jgi:hypothetical protein